MSDPAMILFMSDPAMILYGAIQEVTLETLAGPPPEVLTVLHEQSQRAFSSCSERVYGAVLSERRDGPADCGSFLPEETGGQGKA
jgi:hypothetical protein